MVGTDDTMYQSSNHQIAWVAGAGEKMNGAAAPINIANVSQMNDDDAGAVRVDGECDVPGVSKLLSETKLSPANSENPPPTTSESNDDPPNSPQAQAMTQNFAIEHRIFLRAILDLLTERDQCANEADVDSLNTIKIGSLRKKSRRIRGLWKTKFVEIRKGTFSYFDDNPKKRLSSAYRNSDLTISTTVSSGGGHHRHHKVLRKDIPLKASSCTCRAVKIRSVKILPSNSGGAVFELRIEGGSRRLWMANTREERQSWIQAIHNAMIGASVTRGDNFLEYQVEQQADGKKNQNKKSNVPVDSPYRAFLEQYLEVRKATNHANSKEDYLGALTSLRGKSITVPVQWIKSQVDDTPAAASFVENEISSCVDQLWKDLQRDSVEINGEVIAGDSFHGPERIVGKLTQQILSSDASLLQGNEQGNSLQLGGKQSRISEAQAISYARDLLLASDRTRSGGDSYFCAENLCLNRNLVVLCPSSTEATPLSIKVSTDYQQKDSKDSAKDDMSGWALVRSSSSKPWKRRHLVLSHGVLSCYAEAEPKSHILLEEVMLQGAKIGDSSDNNVQTSKRSSAKPSDQSSDTGNIVNITTKDGQIVREYLFEDEWEFLFWNGSLKKSASSLSGGSDSQENNSVKTPNVNHNPSSATPIVDVVVNVCTEYKMCTLDPSGIESEDTWAALRTTFVQKFSLTGGPNGRISRGEALVHISYPSKPRALLIVDHPGSGKNEE